MRKQFILFHLFCGLSTKMPVEKTTFLHRTCMKLQNRLDQALAAASVQ